MIFITGFLYWEYLYLPLNQDLEPPVVVGPEIEKENLEKIIKNLETREKNYYQSLNQEYLDPFQ